MRPTCHARHLRWSSHFEPPPAPSSIAVCGRVRVCSFGALPAPAAPFWSRASGQDHRTRWKELGVGEEGSWAAAPLAPSCQVCGQQLGPSAEGDSTCQAALGFGNHSLRLSFQAEDWRRLPVLPGLGRCWWPGPRPLSAVPV